MLKSLSTSLILRGILALAVGVMALAWPGITVLALVVLFAVYAFMASGLEAMRAFGSRTAGPVLGHLLVGLVDLAAGVVALAWPGPTALVLVLIVASWAVVGGLVEVLAAFRSGEAAGARALFILGGLVSVAFGVVLFAHPGVGAHHPGAAVRPVQPGLRGPRAGAGHRAAAYRERPSLGRARADPGPHHVRLPAQPGGIARRCPGQPGLARGGRPDHLPAARGQPPRLAERRRRLLSAAALGGPGAGPRLPPRRERPRRRGARSYW